MTVEVLKSRKQMAEARAGMRRRRIDCASTFAERVLRKFGLLKGINVGDGIKSWDVYKTIRFIEEHVPKDIPVLDIGACECEILPILHRIGYRDLTGIDLDARIHEMPHADAIRYLTGDFTRMECEDGSFGCVTAISVIEHGFDGQGLLAELSRILRPGGHFIASVDYWPKKIDTAGIIAFGMDWRIFSEPELRDFILDAKRFGFSPHGETDFTAEERTTTWKGKHYTFAWLVLRKDP